MFHVLRSFFHKIILIICLVGSSARSKKKPCGPQILQLFIYWRHICSWARMRAVNLFLSPYICSWPRHGETQKDLTFVSSSVIRKMGKSLEAACKLGNFLFVQEPFALTPAQIAADWREESKLPYFQFFNFSGILLLWLELECLSQRLRHH